MFILKYTRLYMNIIYICMIYEYMYEYSLISYADTGFAGSVYEIAAARDVMQLRW